ncbi:DUF2628 domain-containing protein [Moraxella boevrei]|uniref:DUF2628 domain-containing protein n=1 Tax=Faucicola boevrei TaxID=346665 RepID=UPI003734C11A
MLFFCQFKSQNSSAMLFIEETTPPPFWQSQLSDSQRLMYDKAFIGKRSQSYYLKRFVEFDRAGKLSAKWHWAGFFMTFSWLLYRKRYLDSVVYSVAGWSFIHLNMTIFLVIAEYLIIGSLPTAWQMWTRLGIGASVWLFWASMVARWCDAFYYRTARREIADAIDMYPQDIEQQLAHLQQHGGVSPVGMGLAFGFFAFALLVVQVQFLPIYAKQKSSEVLFATFDTVQNIQNRVESIYQTTHQCPINTPFNSQNPTIHLQILTKSDKILAKSPCIIQATVQNIGFPNRWLNGQTLIMYRVSDDKNSPQWACVTSLNKKQTPNQCMLAER